MLRGARVWLVALSLCWGIAACGSSGPPPAEAPAEPATPPAPAATESAPEPTAGTDAPPQDAGASESSPGAEPASDVDAQRDIRYVQTPEGLRVEILGVKFMPKAETVKTPSGIGVKLTI